jgi:hypothetical protein
VVAVTGVPQSEILGAVRFPVPAGWTVQQQVMLQLPCSPGADGIEFQPNIVMVIHPLVAGSTIDAIAEDRARMLEHHLSRFERGLSLWGELFGQRAVRMTYAWQHGALALRQVLVMCALEASLYELTFSDVASRFDQSVTEFDGWLAALAAATAASSARPPTRGRDLSALWPGASK